MARSSLLYHLLKTPDFLYYVQSRDKDEEFVIPESWTHEPLFLRKDVDAKGTPKYCFLKRTDDRQTRQVPVRTVEESNELHYAHRFEHDNGKFEIAASAIDAEFNVIQAPNGAPNHFVRITNVKTFIPESVCSFQATAKQIGRLQRLGMTKDQSFTAQLIGAIGRYRLRALKDRVLYNFRTTAFVEKEIICRHAFEDITALQEIERAHGQSTKAIKAALLNYQHEITDKVQKLEARKKGIKDYQRKWVIQARIEYLKRSYHHALRDLANLERAKRSDTLCKTDFVENFVRERANDIVQTSMYCNEMITIGGRFCFTRGILHSALCDAKDICTNFRFDQHTLDPAHAILKKHQGNYLNDDEPDATYTIVSSFATDGSKQGQRDFLFAASVIQQEKSYDPFAEDHNCQRYRSRGWTRFFRFERDSEDNPITHYYFRLLKYCDKASINLWKLALSDISELLNSALSAIRRTIYSGISALINAFNSLYQDFAAPSNEKRQTLIWTAIDRVLKKLNYERIKTEVTEKQGKLSQDKHYICYERQRISKLTQSEFIVMHSSTEWKMDVWQDFLFKLNLDSKHNNYLYKETKDSPHSNLLRAMRGELRTHAPFKLAPYKHQDTELESPLSPLMGAVEEFANIFIRFFEKHPNTALLATTGYAGGILAIYNQPLLKSLAAKIQIPASATDAFIKWQVATGEAMSAHKLSMAIATASTTMQALMLGLEFAYASGDSSAGAAARYLHDHLPQVLGILAGAAAIGYCLTDVFNIPGVSESLREDRGNISWLEGFFAGLKVGFAGKELCDSEPTKRSVLGTFIAGIFELAILPIRCALTPVNFIFTGIYNFFASKYNQRDWLYVKLPWKELFYKLGSLFLGLTDFTVRVGILTCRIIRIVIKIIFECIMNNLALITKFLLCNTKPAHVLASYILQLKHFIVRTTHESFTGVIKRMARELQNYLLRVHHRNKPDEEEKPSTAIPEYIRDEYNTNINTHHRSTSSWSAYSAMALVKEGDDETNSKAFPDSHSQESLLSLVQATH